MSDKKAAGTPTGDSMPSGLAKAIYEQAKQQQSQQTGKSSGTQNGGNNSN
ncbi:TPA: hypothetical protein I8W54_000161 [Morganella morganii]|nr:hypothetical protein [Morganella morganii]